MLRNIKGAFRRWNEDDAGLLAAAVSYYSALSFFPLLLTLISVTGLLLTFTNAGRGAEENLIDVVSKQTSPTLAKHVATALGDVKADAVFTGPIGLLSSLFGALAIFVQFDRAFDRIWNTEESVPPGILHTIRRVLFHRGVAFLMLLSLAAVLMTVFVVSILLETAAEYSDSVLPGTGGLWTTLRGGAPVLINTGVIVLIYRIVPRADVEWKDALRGGLFAGVIWEIGRQILTRVLLSTKFSSAYGVIGSFIAVMLWVYFAVVVLFLGAEYIQEFIARRESATEAD